MMRLEGLEPPSLNLLRRQDSIRLSYRRMGILILLLISGCRHAPVASNPTRVTETPARQWGPCFQLGGHEFCFLATWRKLE